MKVLTYGPPFCTANFDSLRLHTGDVHEIRSLSVDQETDYHFAPMETAEGVIRGISKDWKPDCLLCWCPEVAPPPLEIEKCPIPTTAIVSDWSIYYPQIKHNACRYDNVVTDRPGSEVLQLWGTQAHFVGPLYAQQSGLHRMLNVERDLDVVFAGNLNLAVHGRRCRLLERAASLAGRYNVLITADQQPASYVSLLNRARIAFNHGLRHEMNLRCFEAIACGAVLFIEAENRECGDWLKDREEAVFYTEDTLVPLLEYYLSRPAETQRIAAAGLARASQIAGERRWDAMIDAIAALPSCGRPFAQQTPATRLLAEAFQYASSFRPEHETYVRQLLEHGIEVYPEDPEVSAALACFDMDTLEQQTGNGRREQTARLLDRLRHAAGLRPNSTPVWLNLAFACKHAGSSAAEARFLELALQGTSDELGHLMLNERRDPYAAQYRELQANGQPRVEVLWAGAAARLAALRLQEGRFEEALELAGRSRAWWPEVSAPYRVAGEAFRALGRPEEAAAWLRDGLPHAPFDADYRRQLHAAYVQAGLSNEARVLADESATIFSAWIGVAEIVAEFQALAR